MDTIPGLETRMTTPWRRKNMKWLFRLNIPVSYLQPGATARRFADVLDVIPSPAALYSSTYTVTMCLFATPTPLLTCEDVPLAILQLLLQPPSRFST